MPFSQTDKGSGLVDPAINLIRGQLHIFRTKSNILINCLLKELILRVLEYQPYVELCLADRLLALPDILSVEQHLTRGRLEQPVKMLNQGRLARPGETQLSFLVSRMGSNEFTSLFRYCSRQQDAVLREDT